MCICTLCAQWCGDFAPLLLSCYACNCNTTMQQYLFLQLFRQQIFQNFIDTRTKPKNQPHDPNIPTIRSSSRSNSRIQLQHQHPGSTLTSNNPTPTYIVHPTSINELCSESVCSPSLLSSFTTPFSSGVCARLVHHRVWNLRCFFR